MTAKYKNALLNERNKTHGNFADNARISQSIKLVVANEVARQHSLGNYYTPSQLEVLDMYALKMSRILSGNNMEPDHWRDIGGYSDLVVEELESDSNPTA